MDLLCLSNYTHGPPVSSELNTQASCVYSAIKGKAGSAGQGKQAYCRNLVNWPPAALRWPSPVPRWLPGGPPVDSRWPPGGSPVATGGPRWSRCNPSGLPGGP